MDETALNTSIRKLQETTPYPFPGRWTFRRTTGGYSIRDANKRVVAVVYFVEGSRAANSSRPLSRGEVLQVAQAMAIGAQKALRDWQVLSRSG
jgi:hypothetical protein